MVESIVQPIPEGYLKERGEVFSSERANDTYGVVRRFAESYSQLREVPRLGEVSAISDLSETARESVMNRAPRVFERALSSAGWTPEEKEALAKATIDQDPSLIALDELKNPDLKKTAIGIQLVLEQARNQITADLLKELDEKTLERFGMHPKVRDILAEALPKLSGTNAEYLRFRSRSLEKAEGRSPLYDAIRERRRVGMALEDMVTQLGKEDPSELFGSARKDFLGYLETLSSSYAPFDSKGQLYPKEVQSERIGKARRAFIEFYGANPQFPLIVVPSAEHYISDEVEYDLGLDPEVRILWQSPRNRVEAESIERLRDRFADTLLEVLPKYLKPEDVEGVRKFRALVAGEVASYGVNIESAASAQDVGPFFVLVENVQERKFVKPVIQKLAEITPEKYPDLLKHPGFREICDSLTILHEFTHRVYPEEGEAAERLGDLDDLIAETKSDTFSYLVFAKVFLGRAEEMYGERAQEALNLAMIGTDLEYYISSSSEPYRLGATKRLNILSQNGFLREKGGKILLGEENLAHNLGDYLLPYAQEIARVYWLSERGSDADLRKARKVGERLLHPIPSPLLKKLERQFS